MTPLFTAKFGPGVALVTNEHATYNPRDPKSVKHPDWQLNSGSLFSKYGAGWTGRPDNRVPNATSSDGTGSATFRALVQRWYRDTHITLDARVDRWVTTDTTPAQDWDGMHVWVRYQNEASLYAVSIIRRDGHVAIKKKVPNGDENGGTYYTLAEKALRPMQTAQWRDVRVTAYNQTAGVKLVLAIGGKMILSVTDAGVGGPPIRDAGRTGLRCDNVDAQFKGYTISSL